MAAEKAMAVKETKKDPQWVFQLQKAIQLMTHLLLTRLADGLGKMAPYVSGGLEAFRQRFAPNIWFPRFSASW